MQFLGEEKRFHTAWFITGKVTEYAEPCAALKTDGPRLIDHLSPHGFRCVHDTDVRSGTDALTLGPLSVPILTNTPHARPLMHAMFAHFMAIAPFTWALVDFNWLATIQAAPFIPNCSDVVVIGRVRWIPGSRDMSKDDYAWLRLDAKHTAGPVIHARIKTERAR